MVADPYVLQLTLVDARTRIPIGTYRLTADDVANNFALNSQDGLAFVTLPGGGPYAISDIFATEDGADTTSVELYVNGLQSPFRWSLLSISSAANVNRVGAPPVISGGKRIALKQLA